MISRYALSHEDLLQMDGQPVYALGHPTKRAPAWYIVHRVEDSLSFFSQYGLKDKHVYGQDNFFAFRDSNQSPWHHSDIYLPAPGQSVQVICGGITISVTYMKNHWLGFDGEVYKTGSFTHWRPFVKPLPVVYTPESPFFRHIRAQTALSAAELHGYHGRPVYVPANTICEKGMWCLVHFFCNMNRVQLKNPHYSLDAGESSLYGTAYFAVEKDIADWNDLDTAAPRIGERVQVAFAQKTCCMEYRGDHWVEHFSKAWHSTQNIRYWQPMADPSLLACTFRNTNKGGL